MFSPLYTETEGLYATNNQFQKAGPKGFIEVKVLENDKLYVRVDLPGVPDDAIRHRVDGVRKKIVFFSGETLHDGNKKDGVREYSGTAGLGCDCCEITGVDAKMKDGVLRMIVSRVKVKDQDNKCTLTVPPFTGFYPQTPKVTSFAYSNSCCKFFKFWVIRQVNPEDTWRIIRFW